MNTMLNKFRDVAKEVSVLYVEDDVTLLKQMVDFLMKFFKSVDNAQNGEDGLRLYIKNRYDIVITDIKMPIMDGFTMSKKIREINQNQEIIVITAYNSLENLKEALEIGVNGFVIKPPNYPQMLTTLYNEARNIVNSKQNEMYREHLEEIVKIKTAELERQYTIDTTTNLYNYFKLKKYLDKNIDYALILLNIDNFKNINDTYGMIVGDEVLKAIASVLKSVIKFGKLFRIHGDEFMILSKDISENSALEIARDIQNRFTKSIIVLNIEFEITFSIGIAIGKGIDLLKFADIAIDEMRLVGKNRVKFYTPNSEFEKHQKEQLIWINRVKHALKEECFTPFFQPIINNKTMQIEKYECLARMKLGNDIVSPIFFLAPAKVAGLLPNITRVMIEKSFDYFQDKDFEFAINIADYDLNEGYLPEFLDKMSNHYSINPNRVVIEILESISVYDAKTSISQLKTLKNRGFKLAIDDFGTESSNFSRLLDLDVDYIKIDGSFIKNLHHDLNSQKITNSIVKFARSINAKIIAEFVHSEDVFKKVLSYNIDYSQGYYLGEPKQSIE